MQHNAPWPPPDVLANPTRAAPTNRHQTPQHNASIPWPPSDVHPQDHLPRPSTAPYPHPHPQLRPSSAHQPHPQPQSHPTEPRRHPSDPSINNNAPPGPSFLIIGLFALRLTHRLISTLPQYATQSSDLHWLTTFLAPYPSTHDLAAISGATQDEYMRKYPEIVGRMKRQAMFPVRFGGLNPLGREGMREGERWSNDERREVIDFVHAAAEWGSTVLVPEGQLERLMDVAERRRVADPERGPMREQERGSGREHERGVRFGEDGGRVGGYRAGER